MIRVGVDFNRLVRDGLVQANIRHADGLLVEGAAVEAYDLDDLDMRFDADVVEVDGGGRALLRIHWIDAGSETMDASRLGPTQAGV